MHHPRRALLIVPHEHGVESGLWGLRLCFWHDDLQLLRDLLFWNHLHRVLLFHNDYHLGAATGGVGIGGGTTAQGCGCVASIIFVILLLIIFIIVVLTHVVDSILVGHLDDHSSWDWIIPSSLAFSSF
jgi:hypothetical protein